jgi:hypothetical protein
MQSKLIGHVAHERLFQSKYIERPYWSVEHWVEQKKNQSRTKIQFQGKLTNGGGGGGGVCVCGGGGGYVQTWHPE